MRAGDDENEVSEMVHREHPKLRSLAGLLNARRREAYSLSSDVFLLLDQSKPLWQPRVVQTVSIDRLGHASFRRLKPGTYWIMGYVRESWAEAFWLQQLSVGSGATTVALNQSNTLYSKIVEARPKFE
jgi:predicted RNA polymerase sigma factor